MSFPLSTGEVRTLLNCPEHRLVTLIRNNHLVVPVVDGARHWGAEHVLDAARLLKCDQEVIARIQADLYSTKTEA